MHYSSSISVKPVKENPDGRRKGKKTVRISSFSLISKLYKAVAVDNQAKQSL